MIKNYDNQEVLGFGFSNNFKLSNNFELSNIQTASESRESDAFGRVLRTNNQTISFAS